MVYQLIAQAIVKSILLRRAVNHAKRVKINAYRKHLGLPPIYPCYQRPFRAFAKFIKWIFLSTCCKCCVKTENDEKNCWDRLWTSGTYSNSVLKSFIGLLSGFIFTELLYYFLIYQLNIDPWISLGASCTVGIFLSLSLAFSKCCQCLGLLTFPQFFTKKGRAAILVYALILATSGPAKNTAKNMEVLSESLLCAQELAQNATKELARFIKEPMQAFRDTIKNVGQELKIVAKAILGEFNFVLEAITSVVNAIMEAYKWLNSIVSTCNDKFGSPFDRCMDLFDEARADCAVQLGENFEWMCSAVDGSQYLCHVAKITDLFCWLPGILKEAVFAPIKEKLKEFVKSLKKLFDIKINIEYKFSHKITPSKNFKQIVKGMKKEIHQKIGWLFDYIDWLDILASLFLFIALYKAIKYRHKYLKVDRHDNRYITSGLIRLDQERTKLDRDTIFPLRFRESKKYVPPFTLFMIKSEKKQLFNSFGFISMQSFNIFMILMLDFSLYLFLEMIRKYCGVKIDLKEAYGFAVTVEGEGFLATMYRAILIALSPIGGLVPTIDTTPCLPMAYKPDFARYALIFFLILSCYFLAYTECYGMRLRHWICGKFYPDRILPRERWLYIHILSTRGNFFSFAAGQLKAKVSKDKKTFKVGLCSRLRHKLACCRFIWKIFGWSVGKQCFLCGKHGDLDDFEDFVHCQICDTVYCQECFQDLKYKCPACLTPFDSDFSGFSEEKGSSSEEDEKKVKKLKKKKWWKRKSRKNEEKLYLLDSESSQDQEYENYVEMREFNHEMNSESPPEEYDQIGEDYNYNEMSYIPVQTLYRNNETFNSNKSIDDQLYYYQNPHLDLEKGPNYPQLDVNNIVQFVREKSQKNSGNSFEYLENDPEEVDEKVENFQEKFDDKFEKKDDKPFIPVPPPMPEPYVVQPALIKLKKSLFEDPILQMFKNSSKSKVYKKFGSVVEELRGITGGGPNNNPIIITSDLEDNFEDPTDLFSISAQIDSNESDVTFSS